MAAEMAAQAAEMAAQLYNTFTGGMPYEEFGLEWAPLLSTVVFPVLCLLVAVVGLVSANQKKTAGQRVLKKIMFGVRADVRMVRSASKAVGGKGFKGPTSMMEKGKGKSAGDAEAAAIRQKAQQKGGKGGRFY